MALYTPLPLPEAKALATRFGRNAVAVHGIKGGSVNSNYRLELDDGKQLFVRIYEEQDEAGAENDVALAHALVAAGVPTPTLFTTILAIGPSDGSAGSDAAMTSAPTLPANCALTSWSHAR